MYKNTNRWSLFTFSSLPPPPRPRNRIWIPLRKWMAFLPRKRCYPSIHLFQALQFLFWENTVLGYVTIRNLTPCTINPSDCQQGQKSEKRCLLPWVGWRCEKVYPSPSVGRGKKCENGYPSHSIEGQIRKRPFISIEMRKTLPIVFGNHIRHVGPREPAEERMHQRVLNDL